MIDDEPLDVPQVCEILQLSRNTVYRLAKTGELPSYRIGRKLRFTREDIDTYLRRAHGDAPVKGRFAGSGAAGVADAAGHSGGMLSGLGGASTSARADGSFASVSPSFRTGSGSGERGAVSAAASPFVLAGHDLAADLFANRLNVANMPAQRCYESSYDALVGLYAGRVDAAFIHLFDLRTSRYNVPFVQRLAPGLPVVIVRLHSRMQGFIVAAGNPHRVTSWGGLLRDGVCLANRAKGSGARVLLDQRLIGMEAVPGALPGYDREFASGVAAARAVAAGEADVAIGTPEDIAAIEGVEFVPVHREQVDVAVAKTERTRPLVRAVKRLAADSGIAGMLQATGYGTDQAGAILYEC